LEDERAAAEDRAELPDFAAMSAQQVKKQPYLSIYSYSLMLDYFLYHKDVIVYSAFIMLLISW